MPFAYRAFTFAKDPQEPDEFQDAWQCAPEQGVAVVADGVASSLFAGAWARLLVEAVAAGPPCVDDRDRLAAWLAECRQKWLDSIDTSGLAWFQKAKLPAGAFSTLLWVVIHDDGETHRWQAWAIGDSCLFHVRQGQLLRVFPIERAAQFADNPLAIGSVDLKRDDRLLFTQADGQCLDGDWLVLATDAVAQWLLTQIEAGEPPAWPDLWSMTPDDWQSGLERLRAENLMRYDDATLLLLRIGPEAAPEELATVSAVEPSALPQIDEADESTEYAIMPEPLVTPEVIATAEVVAEPGIVPENRLPEKLQKTADDVARGIEDAADQVSTGIGHLSKAVARFFDKYIRPNKPRE